MKRIASGPSIASEPSGTSSVDSGSGAVAAAVAVGSSAPVGSLTEPPELDAGWSVRDVCIWISSLSLWFRSNADQGCTGVADRVRVRMSTVLTSQAGSQLLLALLAFGARLAQTLVQVQESRFCQQSTDVRSVVS